MFKKFFIITIMVLFCTACAAFNRIVTSDALVAQLATEAATARVLHEHPAWKAGAVRITDAALAAIDSGATASLAEIQAYVEGRVNWARLLPEEQAIVSILINETRQRIEDAFRARGLADPQAQLVEVRQVLAWINAAAKRQ